MAKINENDVNLKFVEDEEISVTCRVSKARGLKKSRIKKRGIVQSCVRDITSNVGSSILIAHASREMSSQDAEINREISHSTALHASRKIKLERKLQTEDRNIILAYTKSAISFNEPLKSGHTLHDLDTNSPYSPVKLDRALSRLGQQAERVTLHRGISFSSETVMSLKNGDIVTPGVFTSTSTSKVIARDFMEKFRMPKEKQIMLVFDTKNAANIAEFSALQGYQGQAEYIIRPDALFRVTKVMKQKDGVTYIVLDDKIFSRSNRIETIKNVHTGKPVEKQFHIDRNNMVQYE